MKRGQNVKYLPYAFTEHGAIMAANVLNSPQAVQMSVFVVRTFVKIRSALADNRDLGLKFALLEQVYHALPRWYNSGRLRPRHRRKRKAGQPPIID